MLITVSERGKICTPREILTIARCLPRGLLLEVESDQGNPYALLLRSKSKNSLEAVHLCYAVEKGMACKHLRTALFFSEQWLNAKLPRNIEVNLRWLTNEEMWASEDLTPRLLGKEGKFVTLKRR